MNWILSTLLALVAGSVGSVGLTPVSARPRRRQPNCVMLLNDVCTHCCAHTGKSWNTSTTGPTLSNTDTLAIRIRRKPRKASRGVLRNLPDLRKHKAKNLREDLQKLVGPTMLTFSEGRMYVPENIRQNATEQGRLELMLHRITREPERYCEGHLQRLLSEQNNHHEHQSNYQQARAILDEMSKRVAP
ncbi:hypothetical protein QFZ75_000001 [Streptomyces sp. V3I8]|uniref:hypothetical protein n=1 Tax=Streptomyces sp. V3I8 TaxID=3042279 RepID=UPI002788B12C|nr:hypothetical protein [Streptomyces sp. V3I8]MDQ1033585.1 hypothetical protein [Streptomyces sp. V3I8]